MGPVLDRTGEEEQQAGDDAVRHVADQRRLEAGRGERGDAEQDEAHVPDAGVRDEALDFGLRQADQATDEDRGHREHPEHGRHPAGTVGQYPDRHPEQAVGAHLQQYPGEDHRADRRRLSVRVGQPGVQRPQRTLHRERDRQQDERRQLGIRRQHVLRRQDHEVGGARAGHHDEHADQQQHRAEQRVQHELARRRPPARTAPAGDDRVHRQQHDLEEHEEQHEVQRQEHPDDADLDDQQQRGEGTVAVRPQ